MTPREVIDIISLICGVIVVLGGALTVLAGWVVKIKQPEVNQDSRIKACEDKLKDHEEKFKKYDGFFVNDGQRFDQIEKENRILLTSVHALLKHSLNTADREVVEKAEKSLDEYLINK